jgi:hypothetical protein
VKGFKPSLLREEFELLLEHLKLTKKEFFQKYKSCITTTHSQLTNLIIKADLTPRIKKEFEKTEKVEFTVTPEEMGYSKTCEILLSSRESDVINLTSRKIESGIYLWKCTVKIPETGEYSNKYLSWQDGKIMLTDLSFSDRFSIGFDINLITDEMQKLSDIAESKKDRILISERTYLLLKSQKMLWYCLSVQGNVEF